MATAWRTRPSFSDPKEIKLAVLDDYHGIAQGHLDQISKEVRPDITLFPDTLPFFWGPATTDSERQALIDRLKPFHILCTMRERTMFPGHLLEQLPNLLLLHGTGPAKAINYQPTTKLSTYDVWAATKLGISVIGTPGNVPAGEDRTVKRKFTVQHTWALILGLAVNIADDDYQVRYNGGWQTQLGTSLQDGTLGLCGLGTLGAATARIGYLAWGMKIICWSENLTQEKADAEAKKAGLPTRDADGKPIFLAVSKQELFEQSDVLSVHYVLSERSENIISAPDLNRMKSTAFIVNTSRGPLINEKDLLATLQAGKIAGAALDVYDLEPLSKDSLWRNVRWGQNGTSRVLLSPHMGYAEKGKMHDFYHETAQNVEKWMRGEEVPYRLN